MNLPEGIVMDVEMDLVFLFGGRLPARWNRT
jgi:hypothetical protein